MVVMRSWKYFGAYSSAKKATEKIKVEKAHGYKGDWKIVPKFVGKSVDNAYSDKSGKEYQVWLEVS